MISPSWGGLKTLVMNSKENRTGFYAWYDSLTPEEKAEFNKPDHRQYKEELFTR